MPRFKMEKVEGVFQSITLVGEQEGSVKRLSGFDKSRHTVPRFASDRAAKFLGRICGEELSEWGDGLFRALRHALGYKRQEISLDYDRGMARLVAKDFVLERGYSLVSEAPGNYRIDTELSDVSSWELFELDAFNSALGPLFDRMRCVFRRSLDLESFIDAIEEREESGITVEYPGDCMYCEARIQNFDAVFHFDAAELQIRFATFGSPTQLHAAWKKFESAFVANPTIGLLLGF